MAEIRERKKDEARERVREEKSFILLLRANATNCLSSLQAKTYTVCFKLISCQSEL